MAAAAVFVLVSAIVSRGGRPDLAGDALHKVLAPTLLIVGDRDRQILKLHRSAIELIPAPKKLEVVSGATHLFEEPGTLETMASLATDWFSTHMARAGESRKAA